MLTLEDLQTQVNELKARIETLEKERDAAKAELTDEEAIRIIGGDADLT
ncbi:hypothetical protein [Achromobacter sp. MYb9]|nr:hypothetical protein [Achromobacter sp. MYb9]